MLVPEELALSADRVSLRRLTEATAMFAMFSHPEVMRYWSRPAMTGMEQAEALLQQVLAHYQTGRGAARRCRWDSSMSRSA